MKTLEHIKNEYAKSKGYSYWNDILLNNDEFTIDNIYVNELLILVQKECLQNAEKNVYNANSWGGTMDIADDQNIIR